MRYADAAYAFLVAMGVAAVLTPFAGRLARRVGAMAYPTERGLSRTPTPELGGLAIFVGVLVAAIIWLPATINLPHVAHGLPGPEGHVTTWVVLAGAALITLVGAIDDTRPLKPVVKLAGQIAAAVVAVESGAVIDSVTIPFVHSLQFPHEAGPLTVIWLVALMNVVNFTDGVDGLAAGVCTIDGIAFTVIAFSIEGGMSETPVLTAITAGGALGFLFHNFPPAKIFMGDAGANLLGYLLGVGAVIGSLKTGVVVALAVPLLILAVPFLDTAFVVAKRLKYHRKPWDADATHFHHRMKNIGFSQRKTIAYLYAWTLMLAGVACALRFVPYSHHDGHFRLGWSVVMGAILIGALAASVYLVYVLEILKFRGLRSLQIRHIDPDTSEHEIDASVRRDIETGEFERVAGPPRK